MSKKLFTAFQPVSKEAWKNKIIKDLKGKDYNESLQWHSEEGILVEPIYHSEDLEALIEQYDKAALSQSSTTNNNWYILEKVKVERPEKAHQTALKLLNEGAEAIEFDCDGLALTESIVHQLTKDIRLTVAPISFVNYKGAINFSHAEPLIFKHDVISQALLINKPVDLNQWIADFGNTIPSTLFIDGAIYQNAGAKMVEQLAFVLAITNEYLNHLEKTERNKLKQIYLQLAVGTNFFFEIAKLRAVRKLIKVVCREYGMTDINIKIQGEGTGVNKSKLDANNNMLRNTSECMSAIIGGADVVHLNAHDSLTELTEKGRRWARNISHILRNESHFDRVNDPAGGAYYVEELTDTLAEKSWALFKAIEAEGGFLAAWTNGTIQEKISDNRKDQMEQLINGNQVLLGVNKYTDVALKSKAVYPASNPLEPLRLSALFE